MRGGRVGEERRSLTCLRGIEEGVNEGFEKKVMRRRRRGGREGEEEPEGKRMVGWKNLKEKEMKERGVNEEGWSSKG